MTTFARTVIALVTACVPYAASAECPELAKVAWWTNTVPEVRETIKASFQDDWDKYIARWQRYRGDLQKEYDRHGSVRIKSHDVVFRGEDLKTYIATVDQRIATLECLKRETVADAEVATFATAAGGPQTDTAQEEAKAVETQALSIEVSATCRNGLAVFQVTNLGDKWPRLAEISLYRTDSNGMLSQRRVRMVESQEMSITVPADVARGVGEVGLYIEPAWYSRKFEYDARISC